MNRVFLLIIFFYCVVISFAFGQSITNFNSGSSQSPTALSNGEMSNINNTIDMYTGRLNYTVPLKNVKIAGIDIPIGLTYTTNGATVQEVAGNVGLGWNTSFNGVITHVIRGLPDNYYYGYSGPNRTGERCYSNLVDWQLFENMTNGTWDSEPDIYYFTFLTFSGAFVLDPDGNPVLLSNSSGLRIDYCPYKRGNTYASNPWVLRDQLGNQYQFNVPEFTTNHHHGEKQDSYEFYTSTWYLTKIINANNEEINFSYVSHPDITYTNYVNMKRSISGNSPLCSGNSNNTWNENTDVDIEPSYLSQISGNGTTVDLSYNLNRTDLNNGLALTNIKILYNNKTLNTYQLNYDYFTSNDGTNTKRLKLTNIAEQFVGNINKTLYSFYYNEQVNLPARNSLKTDYWGYYNNNSSDNNLIGYSDKSPYFINTQANILQKAITVTGGTINFEYEINNYYANSQNNNVGGLRLKRIYEKDNDAQTTILNETDYDYTQPNSTNSSGQIYLPPNNSYMPQSLVVGCNNSNPGIEFYYSSEQMQSLTDLNGAIVGYSTVTQRKSDGSSTRFTLSNYSDHSDFMGFGQYQQHYNTIFLSTTSPNYNYPSTSYAFARGKILKQELFDNNASLVKQIDYNYSFTTPSNSIIGVKAYLIAWTNYDDSKAYTFSKYTYSNQDYRLASKTESYFNAGVMLQTSTQSYTYTDYANNLLRNVSTTKSGGKIDKQTFRYPFDVIPTIPSTPVGPNLPLTYMTFNNNIANPVEIVHSIILGGTETVISANVTKNAMYPDGTIHPNTEYKFESKSPLLLSQYANYTVNYSNNMENSNVDASLIPYSMYDNFDTQSNLLQSETITKQKSYTANIYGYDGMYKIAQVNNAKQSDVAYTSFECDQKGNWQYAGNPIYDITSVTGENYYDLSLGDVTNSNLNSNKNYTLTYWTKNSVPYAINGTQGSPILLSNRNGWYNYKHTLSGINNIDITGSGSIDELRLCPSNTQMTSCTYDPLVGITSKTDNNNQITYYKYDEYNRLAFVNDNNKNILQAYCYNFRGEQTNCFTNFTSSVKSGSFYKNDCGPGYIGSPVTYVVNAGRYSAGSQVAADGLAQNDVNDHGQSYANAHGTCTAQLIYARVEMGNYIFTNYYDDQDNYGDYTTADVHVNLYSDATCTSPYVLTQSLNVIVSESSSTTYGYGGSGGGPNNVTFTILPNTSSLYIGNAIVGSSNTYTDPRSGIGTVTDYSESSFDMANNGAYYISLPTKQ